MLNDRIALLLSSRAAFVDPPYSHESVNPYPVQPFGFLLGVLVAVRPLLTNPDDHC